MVQKSLPKNDYNEYCIHQHFKKDETKQNDNKNILELVVLSSFLAPTNTFAQ